MLSLCLLAPQGGFEQPPVGLTVVVVDVGHGSSTVIRAPDGAVHVIDGGLSGQGTAAVDPVIRALSPTAYGYTVATHYHTDHIGGLDEVLNAFPFQVAFDRGDESPWSSSAMQQYLAAAGARRRTPTVGQVLDLGGGAEMKVLAVNGAVLGGTQVAVRGKLGEENARSIAMRLDYGDFSMWLGGDLTGGVLGEPDVETPTSLVCGDVDVYLANHHGSQWSTNSNLVTQLQPELACISAGIGNGLGAPAATTIDRLNSPGASVPVIVTTVGSRRTGYSVGSSVTITTDGRRYRATAAGGDYLDFVVDEVGTLPPGPSDVRISEVQRVPGRYEAFLEVANVGARPFSFRDVRVASQAGNYLIGTSAVLLPGRSITLQRDGDPARNGGQPLGLVWPNQTFALAAASDTLRLSWGPTQLDLLSYGANFSGGSGVSAERVDLLGASVEANFVPAVVNYGRGVYGTPGSTNTADLTSFTAGLEVVAGPGWFTLHGAALSHGGMVDVMALSLANGPGFSLLGTTVPLALDPLLTFTFSVPGFVGVLPAGGYRSFRVDGVAPLAPTTIYGAHVVIDLANGVVPTVSPATPFVIR